jgi:heterodisulfide reductase subunit A
MKGRNGRPRIGVYVCHCGINIAGVVNVGEVVRFAQGLPGVVVAREYKFMCSEPGQDLIKQDIKEKGVERVVVASCSPLMHEITFRSATQEGGQNPFLFHMVNIREHVSWVTDDSKKATEKAKALVAGAVRRVAFQIPLERPRVSINPDVLVVGGGIAGIHASLILANSGKKVYLVEKEPSIGGHMAKFDKTFPTLDCAACILTPKMTEAGQHPNIELMTYHEVVDVSGYVGNFKVRIKKKPRYVTERCTGCGECVKGCPVEVEHEFDEGLSRRKAIFIPFPQAVPNKYVIDKRGVSPCQDGCPAGVKVHGYVALISQKKYKEALDLIRKTLPFPLICGRACHHPCETKCNRREIDEPISIRSLKRFVADWAMKNEDKKAKASEPTPKPSRPDAVAVIGAGPAGLTCALRLVEMGYPVTVFEAASKPGGMITHCIPNYRIPKEIANHDIDHILNEIKIRKNTKVGRDITLEELKKEYKAIFIAIGMQNPAKLAVEGIEGTDVLYGLTFLREVKEGAEVELGRRVIIIGGGNVAIDCAKCAKRVGAEEVHIVCLETRDLTSKDRMPAHDWEIEEVEEEGVIIHPSLGPKRILSENGKFIGLETVVCTSVYDEEGKFSPKFSEKAPAPTIEGDTLIIAIGQRPDLSGFDEIKKTPWQTIEVDEITLQTNLPQIFAGGDIVRGPASVVEAVADGNEAAISIDRFLRGVDLKEDRKREVRIASLREEHVERVERIKAPKRAPQERIRDFGEIELGLNEEEALKEAKRCLNCAVCSECMECLKLCEAEAIAHDMEEEYKEIEVGSIIVATGFQVVDPSVIHQYGYKRYNNVITALEFERLCNASGPTGGEILLKDGRKPNSVAILHCVGSRDKNYHEYCSRVCCMYSLKFAHLVKERTNAKVYNFYIDMRTPGKGYEEFYYKLLEEGVEFIRGRPEVTDWAETPQEEGKLIIRVEDTLTGTIRRVPVDMVILSVGLEPRSDAADLSRIFNISRGREGFFLERHPKLAPISTFTDGIFLAGACQGPKDIPDTVAQAGAAAAEALALIDQGFVELEPNTVFITEELCSGCKTCVDLCPFSAISFDERKGVSRIEEAICKGCGACVAACPSGAAGQNLFQDEQIYQEIEGVLQI